MTIYDDLGDKNHVNTASYDVGLIFLTKPIALAPEQYAELPAELFPWGSSIVNVGANVGYPLKGPPVIAYNAPTYNFWTTVYDNTGVIQPGDSGGGAYLAGTHIILGVNSGTAINGSEVMARTDQVVDWINANIALRGL